MRAQAHKCQNQPTIYFGLGLWLQVSFKTQYFNILPLSGILHPALSVWCGNLVQSSNFVLTLSHTSLSISLVSFVPSCYLHCLCLFLSHCSLPLLHAQLLLPWVSEPRGSWECCQDWQWLQVGQVSHFFCELLQWFWQVQESPWEVWAS